MGVAYQFSRLETHLLLEWAMQIARKEINTSILLFNAEEGSAHSKSSMFQGTSKLNLE